MENNEQKNERITLRNAINVGFELANKFAENLDNQHIPPSKWPQRFPQTLKQIKQLPQIQGNIKIAKRAKEAAVVIWKDMREQAINVEKDMMLHPELYITEEVVSNKENGYDEFMSNNVWRHLSVSIEEIAGNLFVNEYLEEELARNNINAMLGRKGLREYKLLFEDDFSDFIHEVREEIRKNKYLPAVEKLNLICKIGENIKPRSRKTTLKAIKG